MSTRTVTYTIRRPDGTPWAGAELTFRLVPGSFDATSQYPPDVVTSTAAENGTGNVDLWTNEAGEVASVHRCTLPSAQLGGNRSIPAETFDFTLPAGEDPIDLSVLRLAGVTPFDPQYETLITFIESNPELVGPQGPQGDTGLIMSGFVGITALDQADYDALDPPAPDRLYVVVTEGDVTGLTAIVATDELPPEPEPTALYLTPEVV